MSKILVIDSEPGMRQIIDRILAPQGYEIFSAEDGAQALANCAKINPDLVLLDVRLPDMESVEIMEGLRKMKPAVPIVILSGFGDAETAVELVKKGAFNFIHKPFKVDALRQMVKKALNNRVALAIDTRVEEVSPDAAGVPSMPVIRKVRSNMAFVFAGSAALLLLCSGFFAWKLLFRELPEAAFPISYSNTSGIGFDGKQLWVADWADETIYQHKRDDKFSVIASYKTQGLEPTGLAFDGTSIWVSHSFGHKIYKRKLDATLTLVDAYTSPGPSTSGLFYDGTNLWSLDFQQSKIYKHTMDATLSVAASFDSPAVNPCGMFKYGKEFYIADASTNRIYKVDAQDFSLRGVYILPLYENKKSHLTGIAWDGRSIWTSSDGIQKVFRCPLKSLKPVKL
jgi:CheY-like chemotaxis protein/glutamine cyclotransferase